MANLAAPDEALGDDPTAIERYRVELTGYCYRMLGSAFEADDAVQETMVRAWRGQAQFAGRSSVRSWLYRIATNVCLDLLDGRRRRALPVDLGPSTAGERPEATWLQPVPDDKVIAVGADPADVAIARATIRLAFVAALQHLPPRQRAVLILRDVLGWPALEVAALLDTSGAAVHSALARARVTVARVGVTAACSDALGGDDAALLERYVDAFERYDVDALVALLREDAIMSMPPVASWYRGPVAIGAWWHGVRAVCGGSRLVATDANGGPAFGLYHPSAGGGHDAFGIHLLEVAGGAIATITTFIDPRLFPLFGLPDRLR